jgi:hypothetical protein
MNLQHPTEDQIAVLTRMARELPNTDIANALYVIQEQGPQTAGAIVLRRAIAEILALRMMVRKMHSGETR